MQLLLDKPWTVPAKDSRNERLRIKSYLLCYCVCSHSTCPVNRVEPPGESALSCLRVLVLFFLLLQLLVILLGFGDWLGVLSLTDGMSVRRRGLQFLL